MSDSFRVTVSGGNLQERTVLAHCIATDMDRRGFRDVGIVDERNRRNPVQPSNATTTPELQSLRDQIARTFPRMFERKLSVVVLPPSEDELLSLKVERNTLNEEIVQRERDRSLDQKEELLEEVSDQ